MWDCHRVSAVVNRAISLGGDEAFTSNNELAAVVEIYLKGRVRPRDLVALLDLTRGGVTNLLDRLEDLGAVRRSKGSDDDHRGVDVTLTAHGTAIVERIANAYVFALEVLQPLLDGLASMSRSAGFDLGDYHPVTQRKPEVALAGMLDVAAAVPPVWNAYRAGFGRDEPRPGRVFEILWTVASNDGVRPTDIAETVGLSASTTTELIDRLESAGWVQRTRSETDRRVVLVGMLPAGRSRLDEAITHAEPHIREFVAQLLLA